MKLLGKRVLINVPQKKESVIELTAKDEDEIMREAMKVWNKLEVFAVGNEVDLVVPGTQVYIPTFSLQSAEKIEIDGSIKLLVYQGDIAIVW